MKLTKREYQIAGLAFCGLAKKEMADRLHVAYGTINVLLDKAYKKTGTSKLNELGSWWANRVFTLNIDFQQLQDAIIEQYDNAEKDKIKSVVFENFHWRLKEKDEYIKIQAKFLQEKERLINVLINNKAHMEQDIRWLQRYDSFHRANKRIQEITESDKKVDDLSELEMEGLIQRFEYTFELGWKVLQDLLKYKGYEFVQGPNGTLQKAFEDGMITDHDGWRRMAKARVTTSHTYNEGDAIEIVRNIYKEYSYLLQRLDNRLNEEKLRLEMNTLF